MLIVRITFRDGRQFESSIDVDMDGVINVEADLCVWCNGPFAIKRQEKEFCRPQCRSARKNAYPDGAMPDGMAF